MAKPMVAYTPNGTEVRIPDVRVKKDKPYYFALPMRGWSHTLAVYDRDADRFVGFVTSDDLGYETAKDFEKSADYHKDAVHKLIRKASERRRAREGEVYYSVAYQGSGGGFHSAGTFDTLAEAKEEAEYRCALRHFAEIHKYEGDDKILVWECGSML